MKRFMTISAVLAVVLSLIGACSETLDSPSGPSGPTPNMTQTEEAHQTATAVSANATATAVAQETCTTVIGCTGTATTNMAPYYMILNKYTIASAAEIKRVAVSANFGGNYRVGIYADNAGTPGNLLSDGGLRTAVAGLNTSIYPTITLPAGTYWVAVISEANVVGARAPMASAAAYYAAANSAYLNTGLPATLPTLYTELYDTCAYLMSCAI